MVRIKKFDYFSTRIMPDFLCCLGRERFEVVERSTNMKMKLAGRRIEPTPVWSHPEATFWRLNGGLTSVCRYTGVQHSSTRKS